MPFPAWLPRPDICSQCGAAWTGWIVGPSNDVVKIECINGHELEIVLTPEQAIAADADNAHLLAALDDAPGDEE